MEMDTAESVSKGCFSYKGKKKIAKPVDYFPQKDASGKAHHQVYQNLWDNIHTEIQIFQSDLNSKIFDNLLQFAQNSHTGRIGVDYNEKQRSGIREIPTAALITGVNTPDHAVMFTNLVDLLKDRVTPLVSALRSKDCPKLKAILSKMISQLTANPDLIDDDEEEDDVIVNQKGVPCTMSTLVRWYTTKYSMKKSSPKKRRSKDGQAVDVMNLPSLVIVLEDMESFPPHVLQDFIVICSNYIHDLPFVLVFGIATAVTAVHRLLPNAVSSLLCMEKFQAPPSSEYLTQVINKVLMTPHYPFKLGAKVFQLLLDVFLYHDFSVINFVKGLQFCMLDHFYSHPLSHLCCPESDIKSAVGHLGGNELEQLRQTSSFMRYVEGCPPSEIPHLLEDDKFLKERAVQLLHNLHKYHRTFFPVLFCLQTLVSKLPRHPLGKQLREVYAVSLESHIVDLEGYKESMTLLGLMSKDELSGLVNQCIEKLQSSDLPDVISAVPGKLRSLLNKANNLEEMDETEEDTKENDDLVLEKTNLHNLRKSLQEIKKKKKQTPYERWRAEVLDYLDSLFREYLKCPKQQTFHELLYYNSVSVVKKHINASPRSALQTALSCPSHYLQCECCDGEPGTITPAMPDVCIVYKLHLECGQLINLYDWLQAFVMVVTAEENSEKQSEPDKILQARFIRAVSELQFLGFIKPTKRKTDHVARLTWGGC